MIRVYIVKPPLKILKGGIPDGEFIAEVEFLTHTIPYQENFELIGSNQLCLYDTKKKRIVRRYEIDDWGRIERIR